MVSRVGSVIFLAVVCTMLNFSLCGVSDDSGDTDDDEPLREALLLIKIIRRAGVSDASREKYLLSKHEKRHDNVSSFNNTFRPDHGLSMRPTTTENDMRSMSNDGRKHNEREYRQEFYRRQDYYEDMFGTPPNAKSTTAATTTAPTPIAPASTSTIISSPAKSQPSIANPATHKATVSVKTDDKAQTTGIKTSSNVKNQSLGKTQKLSFKSTKKRNDKNENYAKNVQNLQNNDSSIAQEKDPVMAQVESELKNEMDTVPLPDTNRTLNRSFFKVTKASKDIRKTKILSTLRVHLGGSSRYPIPYPENHALCFTDPLNGLCRTPI